MPLETAWTTGRTIWPCSATWRSTSWAGRKVRHPYAQNSKKPRGITIISSNSSPYFEMRLPCLEPYFAPPCGSHFAQTVNRTKTFHVKHFCPIGASFRSKLIAHPSALSKPDFAADGADNGRGD